MIPVGLELRSSPEEPPSSTKTTDTSTTTADTTTLRPWNPSILNPFLECRTLNVSCKIRYTDFARAGLEGLYVAEYPTEEERNSKEHPVLYDRQRLGSKFVHNSYGKHGGLDAVRGKAKMGRGHWAPPQYCILS